MLWKFLNGTLTIIKISCGKEHVAITTKTEKYLHEEIINMDNEDIQLI